MIACSKLTVFLLPSGRSTSSWLSEVNRPTPCDRGHLARLGEPGEAAGQLLDHAVLPAAQLVEVDLGRARRRRRDRPSPWSRRSPWRRAAGPWTGCSRRSGRRRPGSASARPAPPACRGRRRGTPRCSRRARRPAPAPRHGSRPCRPRRAWASAPGRAAGGRAAAAGCGRLGLAGLELRIRLPSETLSPTLTLTSATVPRRGRRHVHGRLVGLQRDQRVLGLDRVALRDVDLDDRHVLEVADVRDLDLDRLVGAGTRAVARRLARVRDAPPP